VEEFGRIVAATKEPGAFLGNALSRDQAITLWPLTFAPAGLVVL
jgi:hypothetical protein